LQHVITFTNRYITENHYDANMFATIFVGVFNLQDGTLTYVNCGNEPPLLLRNDCTLTTLPPTGPAVGLLEDARFSVKEVPMQENDILLAFTDGIPDSNNNDDQFFGTQRLIASLDNNDISASDLIAKIERQLQEFTGTANQFDDITLLAVARKPDKAALF
jgi:serine phosphatase RsbU (regulator of sigma subunit)